MLNEQQTLQNFFSNAGTDFASTCAWQAGVRRSNARKPFRCPFPGCGKCVNACGVSVDEFAWKSNLNTHMHIHDNSRKKEYVCNFPNCGKAFYDAQHLRQHCWIHTRNPEVSAADDSDAQGSSARTRAATRSTRRTAGCRCTSRSHHKNEKRFVCPFEDCGKTFVAQQRPERARAARARDEPQVQVRHGGRDKSFVSQGDLKRHMLTHHHFGENVTIGMMSEEAGDMGRMVWCVCFLPVSLGCVLS